MRRWIKQRAIIFIWPARNLIHSKEDARSAKQLSAERFRDDTEVTSVGLNMTSDRSDYGVTITVANGRALERMPRMISSIPVRTAVCGEAVAL